MGSGPLYVLTSSRKNLHHCIVIQKWDQKFFIAASTETAYGFAAGKPIPASHRGKILLFSPFYLGRNLHCSQTVRLFTPLAPMFYPGRNLHCSQTSNVTFGLSPSIPICLGVNYQGQPETF